MKFDEIFWEELKIDALKWEGDASKMETIILFSRCQIVKPTSGYYRIKNKYPNVQLYYLPVTLVIDE